MTASVWFTPPQDGPPPRLTLVCLPFAGGGVGVYRSWPDAMPSHVAVLPAQLPGRERRLREAAIPTMGPLVEALVEALLQRVPGPFALFGHSMGGAIAYELARAATARGRAPEHLFVSARRAPGQPAPHPPLFALPRDALVEQVQALYGPLPATLRDHPHLLNMFLPTMRADFQLIDTWKAPTDVVLDCPVTAYGAADDQAVPPSTTSPWGAITRGPYRHLEVPGGHFCIRERHEVRDDVAHTLAAAGPDRA